MDEASSQGRLLAVRSAVAGAARLAKRAPETVTLIAVSKTHPAEAIMPLLEAGHVDFGENRVQEAAAKWPDLKERFPGVRLHLIGQLQSNKAQDAVDLFDVIHSLDRSSLVTALVSAARRSGRSPDCFIQVDFVNEAKKGGCTPQELPGLLADARAGGLPVIGLMCIPPAQLEPAPWFALLAELARRHELPSLSMGMSSNVETAVMIGSTHVRVGTALFGERAFVPG